MFIVFYTLIELSPFIKLWEIELVFIPIEEGFMISEHPKRFTIYVIV